MSESNTVFNIEDIVTDSQKEVEGVWCPFPNGAEVKIARTGNDEYNKLLRRKVKANRAVIDQNDDLAAKVGEEVLGEVFAHTIIKDLRRVAVAGIQYGEGGEPYTPALGIKLMKHRDFRDRVKAYADDAELFRAKQEEAAVKNS